MNRKNFLLNLLLVMILIALALGAYYFKIKIENKEEKVVTSKVVLKDISYGSEIVQIGSTSADNMVQNFIDAYNSKNGEQLVQVMDLVSTYIYSDCENESEFDKKYEEKLSSDIKSDEFILMQYSLQREEKGIINGIANNNVQLTLIENSQIEDVTKYLSKMTVKVRTVSETEKIDEVDTLEFLLLHRDECYYIMKYDMVNSVPYTE